VRQSASVAVFLLSCPSVSGISDEVCYKNRRPFVPDKDSTLREQLFNVAEAQAESVVQPDAMADDFRRKPIAAVIGWIRFHPKSLTMAGSS
jgi:hypothetical protein